MNRKTAHSFEGADRTDDVKITEDVTFAGLHLSKNVLTGLSSAGYVTPSPIQLQAIPIGKCGKDMVIQSKSGTGKTLVFGVIMLEAVDLEINTVQGLILAPTREIAFQNAHVIFTVGSEMKGLSVQVFIGGLPLETDQGKCKACHIAVGTPGRVKQLIEKGSLKTKTMRVLILDEADKLMEDSFADDVAWIFSQLPLSKQVLAVSATYPEALANLVSRYMQKPAFVRLGQEQPTLLGVKQFVIRAAFHPMAQQQWKNKIDKLLQVLKKINFSQCMVFTNLQTRAESLAALLSTQGYAALSISGSQTQTKRLQTLLKLRQYQCKILVATDLAARGIDAEHIDLVVHMDVPRDAATYLHRVGRAGRFGAAALTCTIACEGNELTDLRSIITRTKASVRIITPESLKPKSEDVAEQFSVQDLYEMWGTLPELEGTGLEGEGAADSLLTNIEHEYQPNIQDTAKALLGKGRKKKSQSRNKKDANSEKDSTQGKVVLQPQENGHDQPKAEITVADEGQLEQSVACMHIHDGEADRAYRQKWWDWYTTSMAYVARNKAYIQQSEYIRYMTEM